jgi:hypothetical protein
LGMSIFLLHYIDGFLQHFGIHIPNANIIGVAVGTLVPNVILAFTFNIPFACKFCKISVKEYFNKSVWRNLFVGIFIFVFAEALQYIQYPAHLITVFLYTLFVGVTYLLTYFIFGLHQWERKQVFEFVSNKLKRRSFNHETH